ncbi:tRNA (guanosine(46)-N7)-methyltransferase TrmB [Sunxiuqinia sp. sy24]|uniref:tRNA (guanosine(46)-N7)-methyltransferase TrmB n=1 Tax=Sunxiuqinia sp. sy24 TaxID=3461495 RepID=UPI0040457904
MGKNKLAKFSEMATFDHVIQAPYNKVDQKDHELKGRWKQDFFKNDHPLVLELGCGKGEYSVSMAEYFPNKNFIGVDIKGARMWKGSKLVAEKGLKNVGFIRTNIEIISAFFEADEVDEIWLTFPDPQMKKDTKRLTSTNFMNRYKQFLKPEGTIHLKTDSNFQYRYTLAMVEENGLPILAETDDLYESPLLDEVLSIQTFYEKQWRERGLPIKYLAFQLPADKPLREPDVEIEKDPYRSFGRSARE